MNDKTKEILNKYGLEEKKYILVTIHRAENTDNEKNLLNIMNVLKAVCDNGYKIFFPIHPRTKKYLHQYGFFNSRLPMNFFLHEPVSYSEMIILESYAKVVMTDSGGVQKEAYFFKTPVVIPRTETEWLELVDAGWSVLVGTDKDKIIDSLLFFWHKGIEIKWKSFYGKGDASNKIVNIIADFLN